MLRYLFLSFYIIIIDAKHFNGGTIRWVPVNPYDNSSSTAITIIQSYWWTYPTITCTNNVPISTSGRSNENANLTCVVDCSTDGGYSIKPVNILTDCISASLSVGMLTSQRAVNTTLTAGAHFYLAYVGAAWRPLNNPPVSGLEWSIISLIDLRLRPDGFINTPPVASVVSPQYIIVNTTTEIQISVSDVNVGDDVRCRWSTYTPGYRRRKRSNEEKDGDVIHRRKKRGGCGSCNTACTLGCSCSCAACSATVCTGSTCNMTSGCAAVTTTVTTTTVETLGTLKSTLSYPHRQAIDECGGICHPGSLPNGTILSNCTLSVTGLTSGAWYGVAIQVEDFINTTDTTPMSSVPIQFLIYVLPQPTCSIAPIILPLLDCLEVTVGVTTTFNLSVLNLCDPNIVNITDIIVSQGITDMQMDNLTISLTNASIVYGTFIWTPQASQIGPQQLCIIAYTSEQVQSTEYCAVFNVITSPIVCATTTISTSAGTAFISTIHTTASSMSSIAATNTAASTAENTSNKQLYWGLIGGLSGLGLLLLLLLCCLCYLYCCPWHPTANRHRKETEMEQRQQRYLSPSTESMASMSRYTHENLETQIPKKSYQTHDNVLKPNTTKTSYIIIKNNPVTSTIPRLPRYSVPTTVPNWSFPRLSVPTVKITPK